MTQKIYQIDAFTKNVFGGNPAAVCILENWLDENLMQKIAMENNLSETAFVVKKDDGFEIRWFAPQVEIALCGHATLASAHVLFNYFNYDDNTIKFNSHLSGDLFATKNENESISLNFPADFPKTTEFPDKLLEGLNIKTAEIKKGKSDYLLILENEEAVINCKPNFNLLKQVEARGIIISAKGNDVDFVSRFFAPTCGVDEDPVTGSAHTLLIPYWSKKLNKQKLKAIQLSHRKGNLDCELIKERVKISGFATTYMIGEINF